MLERQELKRIGHEYEILKFNKTFKIKFKIKKTVNAFIQGSALPQICHVTYLVIGNNTQIVWHSVVKGWL